MEVKVVSKPSFSVIGKLGRGASDSGPAWIKPLWDEANSRFNEISSFVKYDSTGKIAGIWGIMSDVGGQFKRWDTQGMYLAGCEVKDDFLAPPGWTLWKVPDMTYVVVSCTKDTYGEAFNYVLNEYMPEKGFSVVGAIHEYFPQDAKEGEIHLYFPIEYD